MIRTVDGEQVELHRQNHLPTWMEPFSHHLKRTNQAIRTILHTIELVGPSTASK